MSNLETVQRFLNSYRKHDFKAMENCLDDKVVFSDFAHRKLKGDAVKALWHRLCVGFQPLESAVQVPGFEILWIGKDQVLARYRMKYSMQEAQTPLNYVVMAEFRLKNHKIVEQRNSFADISEFQFARTAFGFPYALLALTPFLKLLMRRKAGRKLNDFMEEYGYTQGSFRDAPQPTLG